MERVIFTKQDVLSIMKLDAFDAYISGRGESIEEEKQFLLKIINQQTFEPHEIEMIRKGAHGLDYLKLKLANRGRVHGR